MSLTRLFVTWLALVILMIANGIFRETVLRPASGPATADILSAVLGMTIIMVGTRYLLLPLAAGSALAPPAGHPGADAVLLGSLAHSGNVT